MGEQRPQLKMAKRILEGNVNPVTGQLDTEAAARALLSHRNTPLQDTGFSPAMSLYGRPMRDHLPRQMDNIRQEWQMVADARESAYAKRQLRQDPRLTDRVLEDLKIGDAVQIQNQTGNRPRKMVCNRNYSGMPPASPVQSDCRWKPQINTTQQEVS